MYFDLRATLKQLFNLVILIVLIILLLILGYSVWLNNRPLPNPINNQPLFNGITYTREVRMQPTAMILHVIQVDLRADGLEFFTTPNDDIDDHEFSARTVEQFVDEFDLQLGINADFFQPWKDNGPFNYYPHDGEGVDVRGIAYSLGEQTSDGYMSPEHTKTVYISSDNRVVFESVESPYNAVSGNIMLIEHGEVQTFQPDNSYLQKPHPRTAIGLSEDENTLIIVVVDGRQPNYSVGATMPELAQVMLDYGAYRALNLDGGGSSVLVIADEHGNPITLSSPIHNGIPGRLRPIANHLGIRALPLGTK